MSGDAAPNEDGPTRRLSEHADEPTDAERAGSEVAQALEREYAARTHTGLRLLALGTLGSALLLQLVRDKHAIHWVVTASLVVVGVTAAMLALRARPGRPLAPAGRIVMAVLLTLAALEATAYLGVLSSTVIVLCTAVYVSATTDSSVEAWTVLLLCMGGYALLALLSFLGVLPLRDSILGLAKENHRALLGLTLLAELVFALSFWFARRTRQATVAAITELARARLEAERRGALLAEAHDELARVLDAGRLGRLSGQTLGDLRVGDVVGRGSMGEVYAATRGPDRESVALKVLHPHLLDSSRELARFEREVEITNAIRSEHVAKVLATGALPDGSPYLVLEWLTGTDLAELLRKQGTLDLDQVVELVRQIGDALASAQAAGVVHRDIKPQNLFRIEGGANPLWKVLDFGVSRFIEATSSFTQGPIGTPRYMSPEQCLGRPIDHRADVFALAVVAYRALTGRPAFSANEERSVLERIVKEQPIRPSALVPLPEDVDLVLAIGLAKDRDKRFGSGPELAEALARSATNALPPLLRARARALLTEAPWSETR